MRRFALTALLLLIPLAPGHADPPSGYDPKLHAWFESLKDPVTQRSCCAISNCRFADYRQVNGQFEVRIDGWAYLIHPNIILRTNNPTGRGVVCFDYTNFGPPVPTGATRTEPQDTIEIRCFLPAKPIS